MNTYIPRRIYLLHVDLKLKQWNLSIGGEQKRDWGSAKYIKEYFEVESIGLNPDKIVNTALAYVQQLNCASTEYGGTFGMHSNLPKTEFIASPTRFYKLLESDKVEESDFHCEDCRNNLQTLEVTGCPNKMLTPFGNKFL